MSVAFQSDPSHPAVRTSRLGAAAVFFGLVPVLIGLLLGGTRAGVALYFPWAIGILFWVVCSIGTWTCMYTGTSLAGLVLRPWKPPLWLLLVVGAVLGSLPARYVVYGTAEALRGQMLDGREPRPMPPLEFSPEFLVHYLQGWAGVYVMWVVLGLAFDRLSGVPSYSRATAAGARAEPGTDEPRTPPIVDEPPAASTPVPVSPVQRVDSPLLVRLPEKLGRHVLALEAEDHYVRVYTDRGSTLLLARLSDAISDLGPIDGIRVHRSYWVRRDAVRHVAAHGKGMMLKLSNGLDVPVSQAYKALARQAGLQPTD